MRTLNRNMRTLYYALVDTESGELDEWGNEYKVTYQTPVAMQANIGTSSGYVGIEQFGNNLKYDKVIVTTDMDCPIDETTVCCIDREPSYNTSGELLYDYRVRRVSKSLNSISIALEKVEVS